MTPPERLRVVVEAAFPGATITRDLDFGDWRITPPAPIQIEGDEIDAFSLRYDGEIAGYTLQMAAETIGSVGSTRRIRQALRDRMQSATAHDILAARRRLGL